MKVRELIKELHDFAIRHGDDKEVVMSVDTEGNSYSTLEHFDCLGRVENEKGKVIGCCLWPFRENFFDAVEAVREGYKNQN